MAELGFRMGAHGEQKENLRIPRRRTAPRRNWKQDQSSPLIKSTESTQMNGLNSFGSSVDQMRNQQSSQYQNSQVQPAQSQISTDVFKERLQQRRAQRQSALNQTQQEQFQPAQINSARVQQQPPYVQPVQVNSARVQPPPSHVQPVQAKSVQASQQSSAFWDMSAVPAVAAVPVASTGANVTTSQQMLNPVDKSVPFGEPSTTSVENPYPQILKKLLDLEKQQQEILVKIQSEEVQRRKFEVSLRALHQDITDLRRLNENPTGQQDDIRREMRELQHSINSGMHDTSNKMQEQIRVIIEHSDQSKDGITQSVDDMLRHYHNILYWMYGTVVSDLDVYEQSDKNSNIVAHATAGSRILLHHPMIEIENAVWMQCRNVDKMGNSKMGHVCILEKPDTYWVTDFGL